MYIVGEGTADERGKELPRAEKSGSAIPRSSSRVNPGSPESHTPVVLPDFWRPVILRGEQVAHGHCHPARNEVESQDLSLPWQAWMLRLRAA